MLRKLFLVISMAEELVNKITNEIKRSGFPLEMHCLNVCSKKNTGRMPNIRYSYKGELKEIDLYAFFEEITPEAENPQYTSTSIIVECKKSKYPWVFFSHQVCMVHKTYLVLLNTTASLTYISLKPKRLICLIGLTKN